MMRRLGAQTDGGSHLTAVMSDTFIGFMAQKGLMALKKEKAVCKGSLKSMNDHLEQFAKLKKEVAKKDGERGPGPSAENTSGCCK